MADSQQSQKSVDLRASSDLENFNLIEDKGTTRTLKIDKSSPDIKNRSRNQETKLIRNSELSQENEEESVIESTLTQGP